MVQFEDAANFVEPTPRYHGTGSNLLKKFDIPLSHLDYEYVNTCKNADDLEKILQILQSGEEGYYPHLIERVEQKLAEIKPNSKYLQKLVKVLNKEDLQEKYEEISDDLTKWLDDINKKNDELETIKNKSNKSFPEIRKTKQVKLETDQKKESTRIKSTDYKAWDKYDPDTELLKMDLEDQKMRAEAEKLQNEEKKKCSKTNKVKFNPFLTKAEAIFEAQRENEKANEYFKAKEIDNSIEHYTNSISYQRNPVTFKNRAAAYMAIKKYQEAIDDYKEALKFNESDFECLFRLGQCYNELKKYHEANVYIENAIFINPNDGKAQKLAENIRKFLWKDPNNSKEAVKTRMKISNVVGEDDEKTKRKNGILKKESKNNKVIVPIPGSSRMPGPYFKVVDRKELPDSKKETKKSVGFNLNIEQKEIVDNEPVINEEKQIVDKKDVNVKKKEEIEVKENVEVKKNEKKEVLKGNEEKKNRLQIASKYLNKNVIEKDVKNVKEIVVKDTSQMMKIKNVEIEENRKKVNTDDKKDSEKDKNVKETNQFDSEEKDNKKEISKENKNLLEIPSGKVECIVQKGTKKIIEIEENLEPIKKDDIKEVLKEKDVKNLIKIASENVEKINIKEMNQLVRAKIVELNKENYENDKNEENRQEINNDNTNNTSNVVNENNQKKIPENIKIQEEMTQNIPITEDLKGGGEPCNENNQEIPREEIHMPYSFVQAWLTARKENNYEGFATILRNFDPDRLTEVIGNKLDATMLNEILNCLYRHFTVVHELEKVYNFLVNLSTVSRFNIIAMFLSKTDKILLLNLFNFLRQHGKDIPKIILERYSLC